jgi:hypothetical protein
MKKTVLTFLSGMLVMTMVFGLISWTNSENKVNKPEGCDIEHISSTEFEEFTNQAQELTYRDRNGNDLRFNFAFQLWMAARDKCKVITLHLH